MSAVEHRDLDLAYYEALVASSDDAIIGQDLEHRITSRSEGAARLYGYTTEEAVDAAA